MSEPIERAKLEEALLSPVRSGGIFNGPARTDLDHRAWCVIRDAAKAYLETLPKTRMVEVWYIEYCDVSGTPIEMNVDVRDSKADAEAVAELMRIDPAENADKYYACIRVTGPHLQCVPQ